MKRAWNDNKGTLKFPAMYFSRLLKSGHKDEAFIPGLLTPTMSHKCVIKMRSANSDVRVKFLFESPRLSASLDGRAGN